MAKVCHVCKNGDVLDTCILTATIGNKTYAAQVRGTTCNKCGESSVGGYELYAFNIVVARMLLENPELKGEGFHFCRKTYGVSRENCARHNGITSDELKRLEELNAPVNVSMRRPIAHSIEQAYDALEYKPAVTVA